MHREIGTRAPAPTLTDGSGNRPKGTSSFDASRGAVSRGPSTRSVVVRA